MSDGARDSITSWLVMHITCPPALGISKVVSLSLCSQPRQDAMPLHDAPIGKGNQTSP